MPQPGSDLWGGLSISGTAHRAATGESFHKLELCDHGNKAAHPFHRANVGCPLLRKGRQTDWNRPVRVLLRFSKQRVQHPLDSIDLLELRAWDNPLAEPYRARTQRMRAALRDPQRFESCSRMVRSAMKAPRLWCRAAARSSRRRSTRFGRVTLTRSMVSSNSAGSTSTTPTVHPS